MENRENLPFLGQQKRPTTRLNRSRRREVSYRDWMRDINGFLHLDFDGALTSGSGFAADGSLEIKQERPGRLGFGRPLRKLGETPHFLQQLQHFNSRCHARAPDFYCKSRAMAEMRKKDHLETQLRFCLAQPAA
jgi:hypothetical protein